MARFFRLSLEAFLAEVLAGESDQLPRPVGRRRAGGFRQGGKAGVITAITAWLRVSCRVSCR